MTQQERTTKSINLQAGEYVLLTHCDDIVLEWVVNDDQRLTITGVMEIEEKTGISIVNDYRVRAECMHIPADAVTSHLPHNMRTVGEGSMLQQPTAVSKFLTDIGGLWLERQHKDGTREKVAFLHNGFGDGWYTLRFLRGQFIR